MRKTVRRIESLEYDHETKTFFLISSPLEITLSVLKQSVHKAFSKIPSRSHLWLWRPGLKVLTSASQIFLTNSEDVKTENEPIHQSMYHSKSFQNLPRLVLHNSRDILETDKEIKINRVLNQSSFWL